MAPLSTTRGASTTPEASSAPAPSRPGAGRQIPCTRRSPFGSSAALFSLAVREALLARDPQCWLVLLTDRDEADLGVNEVPLPAVATTAAAMATSRAEGIASLQGRAAASRACCKGRSLPCTTMEAGGGYEHPWGVTRDGVAEGTATGRPDKSFALPSRHIPGALVAHSTQSLTSGLSAMPACPAPGPTAPGSRVTRTGRPNWRS